MDKEFLELYKEWYYSYCFNSNQANLINDKLIKLEIWCKNNKKEAIEYIKQIIKDEPDNIIILLPELLNYRPKWLDNPQIGLYMDLEKCCNWWLNYFNNTKNINYYKNYDAWQRYLKKNYISWRPNIENDPNITLKEFMEGKRNNEKNKSYINFDLANLNDQELDKLYNDGHLGNMTKYINELHFFYNMIEEEIKRRKLKKKNNKQN
jgi:hypothetical protein